MHIVKGKVRPLRNKILVKKHLTKVNVNPKGGIILRSGQS